MKDIILPSESSDAIDLGAINENTTGIIIAYKGCNAIGYILYYGADDEPWELYGGINSECDILNDVSGSTYAEASLTRLVNRLIKDNIADGFKLINFTIALDNYNPDKLSLDVKKLTSKKDIWSL